MKTQSSGFKKLLFGGLAGAVTLGAVLLLTGGSDGVSSTRLPLPGDTLAGEGGGDAISQGSIGRPGAIEGSDKSTASSPIAPSAPGGAPSRDSAGIVTNEASPDGSSSSLVDDRKIVQTASLRLDVSEVGASFEEVGRLAAGAGGFVASSSFSNLGETQVASVTIRVPSARYQAVLGDLRRLGVKVVAEDSKSSDVTGEYTDLGSRLRNLEATETQLLVLLERAVTINEILLVQDRLNNVRSEVEQVKGRMALLDKLTDLATITVHLQPVAAGGSSDDGGRLGNEISAAWDDSIEFLTDIVASVLHVVVFAWWVPIAGIPALLIGSRLLRSRPRADAAVD